jgi:hypothetical protein
MFVPWICTLRLSGNAITVSTAEVGTSYSVTYEKLPDQPQLLMTHSWLAPHITTPSVAEFRAKAFHAAVDKARELGWIV